MEKLIHIFLTVLTIFLIVLLISIASRLFATLRSGYIFRDRNFNPSALDKLLFFERNPFAWRIGFAYSLLGYSQEEIDRFNKALYKVVEAEKIAFNNTRTKKFRFLVGRLIQGKSSFKRIESYADTLTSHSVLNEIDPEESLEYILFLEVDRFLNSTVKKIRRDQNKFPPERPPF